ncbi:integrase [Neobacillus cucumis]|uniref:Integrase n=2 Tax=Neobacillus cucumis TaxID=1740721 RepID=A0A2N5HT02_9BACI|nr:integrase [Neobacillus cucumis]
MFEEFMLIKKGEGLAKWKIQEHYNNFGYFKSYIGKELSADEMTTELFMGWITYMLEEMDYTPGTVNIRVRTIRAFLRYCYEDKMWLSEPTHKRFKPIKAPVDEVEVFTVEEYRRLIVAFDDETYVGFRTKVMTFVLLDTMVRVFGLVDMKRQNIDFKTMSIRLGEADTKTRVGRVVPISARTAKLLSKFLQETEEFGNVYVFLTYEGEKIGEATVRDNLRVYGQIAKINNKRVSPHTLRYRFGILTNFFIIKAPPIDF